MKSESTKTGEHFKPAKSQGPHASGKANDPRASRRDNHPAKQKEHAKHEALRQDQRISGFDTKTLGSESFPKYSTADRGAKAALEAQIGGNRPGISPKKK